MRSSIIARLIVLGSLAILTTLFIQFYFIKKQEDSETYAFREKAITPLYNVARQITNPDQVSRGDLTQIKEHQ